MNDSPNDSPQLILASASPRRRELLRQIGIRFDVYPTDIDESLYPEETPGTYVSRLALAKARAAQTMLAKSPGSADTALLPILGSDTSVVIDDKILGKPENQADGVSMLKMLSGREHSVYSAAARTSG